MIPDLVGGPEEEPAVLPTFDAGRRIITQAAEKHHHGEETTCEEDWTLLGMADRVAVTRNPLSGTGLIDSDMPDGSAAWGSLDQGLGRVLLVSGQDEIRRIALR